MKNKDLTSRPKSDAKTAYSNSPSNLDPDLGNYFLVRSRTNDSSVAISPNNGSRRRPGLPKSQKSGETNRSNKSRSELSKAPISARSSFSDATKYRTVNDWNEITRDAFTSQTTWETEIRHPSDPPRQPRPGLEWVWFPEGYWAEREVHKSPPLKKVSKQRWWNRSPQSNTSPKRKSKESERTEGDAQSPEQKTKDSSRTETIEKSLPKAEIPRIQIGSFVSISRPASSVVTSRRSSSHKSALSLSLGGFVFTKSADVPQEGLYCRAKRNLRGMILERPKRASDDALLAKTRGKGGLASRTTMVLEGTSQYFDKWQRERKERKDRLHDITGPYSPASSDGRSCRHGFGLAPWHRKNSHESFLSASSSVHKLLMGKPPPATPIPAQKYAGPGGRSFSRVDITSPDPYEPTYLPSEATRIKTPPMSVPGSPVLQPRGLFFNFTPPKDDTEFEREGQSQYSNDSGSNKGKARDPDSSPGSKEWWEADTKHTHTGNKSTEKSKMPKKPGLLAGPSAFDLNLPEHLPSSPLCPKNPLHKGGGKGICAYHGRRRSVKLKVLRRAYTESSVETFTS